MGKLKKFWKSLGPGLVTGASDDDPSGIATYSIAGAKLGNGGLWTMLYTLPFMVVVQEMSARIGISSSCGLAGNIKRYYPRFLLFVVSVLILTSNIFNIGADVSGMAAAVDLLIPSSGWPTEAMIIMIILLLVVTLPYRKITSIFKWLSISLFAYVIAGIITVENWPDILFKTIIPHIRLTQENLILLFAVFGTTISPYIAFWQASEEAEERKIRDGNKGKLICRFRTVTKIELINANQDTRLGMAFSNFIGFFIIALTGAVLFKAGVTDIETVADAAKALQPIAGEYAYLLFTFGIVSSGLLAIPVLAGSAAYVVSEVFNWPASLDKPFSKARKFYMIIIASSFLGLIMTYIGISPIKALFYTSILHGLTAPVLLGALIHMANNPAIVGANINKKSQNLIGYLAVVLMTAGSIMFFMTL